MNNSVVSNDHKEGLVAGCFDLFESYGNDLLEANTKNSSTRARLSKHYFFS